MKAFLLALAATIGATSLAQAAPVLVANGMVQVVFAFKDTVDTSDLRQVGEGGVLFNNQTDAPGATRALGQSSGVIQFRLNDLSTGVSFVNDAADSGPGGDGAVHAKFGRSAADFGVTFSAATNAAIAGLGQDVVLVGFEDRRFGDYDYNDLIFAFSSVQAVPEPASLALLGVGLAGFGMMRRRSMPACPRPSQDR